MNNYYRNKKLTQSAKHEACVSCGINDGTIVWAHSNSQKHGKGIGIKSHDIFGAYLCHQCHKMYDIGEAPIGYASLIYTDKKAWFLEMWEKTMIIACKKGYLE